MLTPPVFTSFQNAYIAVLEHIGQRAEHRNAARGNAARECLNLSFVVDTPADRIVFSPARRTNIAFCFAEALWYLQGRDDLEMIAYYAPGMARFSADGRPLTGTAYGPKLFAAAEDGLSQWDRVLDLLVRDPDSKRAVLLPDALLDAADPHALAALRRQMPLVYVGNQYDRDEQFARYFAPAACFAHQVAGKWIRTQPWPHVNFTGRCPFPQVQQIHRSGLATVLLLPDRYAKVGHQTQRLFEAVLAGCLPLTPTPIAQAAAFTPDHLHVADAEEVIERIGRAQRIAGTAEHIDVLTDCLDRLQMFRTSAVAAHLNQLLDEVTAGARP